MMEGALFQIAEGSFFSSNSKLMIYVFSKHMESILDISCYDDIIELGKVNFTFGRRFT